MSKKDEALKLALEALEMWCPMTATYLNTRDEAITAIREALAEQDQPEQFKGLAHQIRLAEQEVIGTKTWFEDGKMMTKNLTAKDIYKDVEPAQQQSLPACKGMNCGCTDGVSHSPECQAEHAAAIAGGQFVKPAQQLCGYESCDCRSYCKKKQPAPVASPHEQQEPVAADTMYLLRRLLSNQHTLTGPEFRFELGKIVANAYQHIEAPLPAGEVKEVDVEDGKTTALVRLYYNVPIGSPLYTSPLASKPWEPCAFDEIADANANLGKWLSASLEDNLCVEFKQAVEWWFSSGSDRIRELPRQPRKPWVGLTDDEIEDIHCTPRRARPRGKFPFARMIEAKLREKNA